MFKNYLIGLLLIVAISLSFWSIFLSSKSHKKICDNCSDQPDAFLENVVATFMNISGKPNFKLITAKMTHYPQNDISELLSPRIIIYRDSPNPWDIQAKYAESKKGISEIVLWDNVIIHHQSDPENPETTIRTSALTIVPNDQIVKTNQSITLTQPNTLVEAVGMLANWNQGTVKLLSNAREEYVPKS